MYPRLCSVSGCRQTSRVIQCAALKFLFQISIFIYLLVHFLFHLLIRPSICSLFYWDNSGIHSSFRSLICSFIYSLNLSVNHSLTRSSVHSFICPFTYSSVHLVIRPLTQSLVHSFIHSLFIHSFVK